MKEAPTPPELPENFPPAELDPRDVQIATLQSQLQSMEDFANEVVAQRNNAYNESAQLRSQLVRQLKGATQ